MQPRIKMGLLVGAIGLFLNICVSSFIGLCGPFAALIGGAVAGLLAANQEKPATKNEGAKSGAIAGAIAGGLMIVGQVLGAIVTLTVQQYMGMVPLIGSAPGNDAASQAIFYASGMFTGVCFGIVGTVFAAGAGAGAGYLATSDTPPAMPQQYPPM